MAIDSSNSEYPVWLIRYFNFLFPGSIYPKVMNVNSPHLIQILDELYPEHELIELTPNFALAADRATASQLDLECLAVIKNWLENSLGFQSEYDFPYQGIRERDSFVNHLVSGFCLKINGHKIVFIPSESLDTESYEIPQEWVDLSNWMGSYYLPVQVDLAGGYLRLWGAISYQQIKDKAKLDRVLRYYQVNFDDLCTNLDVLWASCELEPTSPLATPLPAARHSSIDRLGALLPAQVPRLAMPFSEWAAVLNSAEQLAEYQQAQGLRGSLLTRLSDWLTAQAQELADNWQAIEYLLDTLPSPAMPTALRSLPDLLPLIENPRGDEEMRWKAVDRLRAMEPDHPRLPIDRVRQLAEFQAGTDGSGLALTISQLAIADRRRAILIRLHAQQQECLPAGIKLSLLDPDNQPLQLSDETEYTAISRLQPLDSYIQLYFIADPEDVFGIRVSMDEHSYQENFVV
jgi:Protein of unknown function (DUF1822)